MNVSFFPFSRAPEGMYSCPKGSALVLDNRKNQASSTNTLPYGPEYGSTEFDELSRIEFAEVRSSGARLNGGEGTCDYPTPKTFFNRD